MSPPLAAAETQNDAESPVKPKNPLSAKALAANRANAKRSRGPVSRAGKERSRLNACKHNHRAELPILPGEDEAELNRRLEVWPQIMQAETEIEHFEAVQAVHMGWRLARSLRSNDAAAQRRMIDLKKTQTERHADEARSLGLELDSDLDPEGVIRKLHHSPAGCNLLLKELTCLQNRSDRYGVLFWSQRERLFHCLGRRLRDLFTDDPTIAAWLVSLLGAVYGDMPPEEKLQAIGQVLEGLRPAWMDDAEYRIRMDLATELRGREESTERLRTYVDAAISDLNERLKRAKARARRELKLELKSAWVDDTASGARRLNYELGHYRSYHAAQRRLETLQKNRRAGGGADTDTGSAREECGAKASDAGGGVTSDTDAGSAATNEPSSAPAAKDSSSPLTSEHQPPSRNPEAPIPPRSPQLPAPSGRSGLTKTNPF